ncbi:hypothetical protein Ana3638_12040 [Anaerocolumna sedimenticola]|uniref:Uncharacterized protein n=1 Tax=Anaerocolumna sedimenticola TaxID=2696063 RepID=A0A6P1TNN2_9FIRM|nr:DUF5301 domain-containing protein [Anaerocolumna sedimenticola]QHQ61416.1 hypothetical protein Ana3638_12040 [Anaerocolumna sedimenticola]
MDRLFLTVLNMSFTASYVILFVMLIRLPLKKAPKVISYALWGVAAFRLICPFSFESMFSLLPSGTASIPQYTISQQSPPINSGITDTASYINRSLQSHAVTGNVNPYIYTIIGAVIWLLGVSVMLTYSIISVLILKRQLKYAQNTGNNIFEAGILKTPFVLGLVKPRIYIPTGLADEEKKYIIRHEQTHISRFDHLIKLSAYLIVSVHWFNPLVWIAFVLMSTDMELSCDERVIKEMGSDIKKAYSSSLLSLASDKRIINGSPLAFGEGNIKGRIKNVLNYKKPAFWIVIATVILVGGIGLGLAFNPKEISKVNDNNKSVNYIQIEINEIASDKITGRIITDKDDYKAGDIVLVAIGGTVTYDVTSLKPGDWINIGYDTVREKKPVEFIACDLSTLTGLDYPAAFTLFESGKIIKSTTLHNPRISAEMPALILSGSYTLSPSLNDTPNASRYLKIDIGSGGDKIYYTYEKGGNYYIEKPYDSIYKVSRETFNELNEYLYKEEITKYPTEQTELKPAVPEWSPEQIIGADMAEIDYATDDIVIFHGYFGLFVYDLNSLQIIRSLDLKSLDCHQTQGDNYCEVSVSTDGNTVQLHPMSSKEMYIYTVSDNTLLKTDYEPMKDRFLSFIPTQEIIGPEEIGSYSYNAVKFENGEHGILHTYDWTLGTLSYARDDMMYTLFDTKEN